MKANNPYIVGITGGIACGKSNVSSYIRRLGFCLIDADEISHTFTEKGEKLLQTLSRYFGKEILNEDGSLKRSTLSRIVFQDEKKREQLNALMHPIIFSEIEKQIALYAGDLVFLDIPLLFETGYDKNCREVWCVYADEEEQLRRLMRRDDIDIAHAKSIIASQMPSQEKIRLSDAAISTNGSYEETYRQVDALIHSLLKKIRN